MIFRNRKSTNFAVSCDSQPGLLANSDNPKLPALTGDGLVTRCSRLRVRVRDRQASGAWAKNMCFFVKFVTITLSKLLSGPAGDDRQCKATF